MGGLCIVIYPRRENPFIFTLLAFITHFPRSTMPP
jgi:hypothetical protein